ncbi:MAG: ABC transporter ATP-binding protein [Dethiosulfovibrio peptidovorans]|nr:MAG: ABC transporter ATP-binding protein [Dethiosulfovibrio peptidovorans]
MPNDTKKPFIIRRFVPYMEGKAILLPISLLLSAVSAALNVLPFVFVWLVAREILRSYGGLDMTMVGRYTWFAFISALAALLTYFGALLSSHLAAFHVEVGLQKVGMRKIMSMPLGFFDRHASGKMRKIVNDGAGTTHTFLAHQLPDLAGTVVSPVILLVLLFLVDWRMGIASLIPILMGFVIMQSMMNAEGRRFQQLYYDSLEEMSSESVEYVRGIPVVKTFGQSIHSFKRFYDSIIKYREMVYAFTLMWRKPFSLYTVTMQAAVFFLIPATILLIGRGGDVPTVLADFIFYLLITPGFSTLMMRSANFRHYILIAEQAIDRLDGLLDYPVMVDGTKEDAIRENSLEFRGVVFSYEGSPSPAVQDVSFRVHEGETVALVGPSGGGKTTIARLAARFWDVDQGEVLVGGVNVRDIPKKELMEHISFVFQNTRLFKGTLRENILFGKKGVSQEALDRAVDASQSRDIVDALPDGLETVMGSKGTYLSGGEQQRIALARAMVKDAPIVLLDEATAFADPENEHLIRKALGELSRGKTTLMIAHRLSSVQGVDRILVVDRGKIVEVGSHDELLKKGGLYAAMWEEYQQTVDWKIASPADKEGRDLQ